MTIPKAQKLPTGMWKIQLRLNGKSITIKKPTEKEVIKEACLIKAQYINDMFCPAKGEDIKLRDAVDNYINERKNVLSPATIRGYYTIRNYRFQAYMDKPIGSIKWQQAINYEATLCSPKTLKNAWGFIHSVLLENDVTTPKVKLSALTKPDKEWLTPEQIPLFLTAVHDKPCEIPALLALSSLRRSEIFGLDWKNIDLEKDVIHIRGALTIDKDNNYVQRDVNKTASSTRDVPIMIPQLRNALVAVKEKKGAVVKCDPTTPYKQVRRICEEHHLPNVGLHGLRHSFASLAYHVGMTEMQTMRIGGWSDFGTMRKIYTHLSQADALCGQNLMKDFFAAGCK